MFALYVYAEFICTFEFHVYSNFVDSRAGFYSHFFITYETRCPDIPRGGSRNTTASNYLRYFR
jgi:hypothetical protein